MRYLTLIFIFFIYNVNAEMYIPSDECNIEDVTYEGNAAFECEGWIQHKEYVNSTWDEIAKNEEDDFLDVEVNQISGKWEFETNTMLVDFGVLLKAADSVAVYYFNDANIDGTINGTFDVSKTNRKGQYQELSHLSILSRTALNNLRAVSKVPEPSTLLILLLGLFFILYSKLKKI